MIDLDGEQVGVLSLQNALEKAQTDGLDLVEVSPKARPPVCRLMDFGKYKYQQSKRTHAAKQNQKITRLKEVKFKPKIEEHDYQFKLRNALRFLDDGDKVKIKVVFYGRMMAHKDMGRTLLNKFLEEVGERSVVEQPIMDEGRNMFMILAPPRKQK